MLRLILLTILQGALLCCGQVFLKLAMAIMEPFSWTGHFFSNILTNWWFLLCGISFGAGALLWMYILKNFPLSVAYPLSSITYVFGMVAARFIFHEQIVPAQWFGIILIIAGCYFIAK